jgi:hypothetical protein
VTVRVPVVQILHISAHHSTEDLEANPSSPGGSRGASPLAQGHPFAAGTAAAAAMPAPGALPGCAPRPSSDASGPG